jgi:hypothetical protein
MLRGNIAVKAQLDATAGGQLKVLDYCLINSRGSPKSFEMYNPDTFPAPSLIMLVTAVIRACDTEPAAFRSAT